MSRIARIRRCSESCRDGIVSDKGTVFQTTIRTGVPVGCWNAGTDTRLELSRH